MNTDFDLWGMQIDTAGEDSFSFCKKNGYIGVGWMLEKGVDKRGRIKEIYEGERGKFHTGAKSLIKRVSVGDFVWLKDSNDYYLAKVTSDWKQKPKGEQPWTTHDIGFYRDANWRETNIDESAVPGFVIRYFAGRPGTMKKLRTGVNIYSKRYTVHLFNHGEPSDGEGIEKMSKKVANSIDPSNTSLLDVFGPRELEDIVLVYLQSQGWRVITSSRPKARNLVECTLHRHSDTERETAYVQVKSGGGKVDVEDYYKLISDDTKVFIHQRDELKIGEEDMEYISPSDLLEYLGENIFEFDSMTIHKLAFALGIRE